MKNTWILYLITKIDENPRVVLVQRQKTFGAIRGIIAPDFSQAQIVRNINEIFDRDTNLCFLPKEEKYNRGEEYKTQEKSKKGKFDKNGIRILDGTESILGTMNESDDQAVSLEQRLGNWRNGNNVGADYRDTARWDENYAKLSRFKAYREQAAAETNDRFERIKRDIKNRKQQRTEYQAKPKLRGKNWDFTFYAFADNLPYRHGFGGIVCFTAKKKCDKMFRFFSRDEVISDVVEKYEAFQAQNAIKVYSMMEMNSELERLR